MATIDTQGQMPQKIIAEAADKTFRLPPSVHHY
jgi:hypothetical protein